MNWSVTITYKRGPAFGAIPVIADTAEQAIEMAKEEAAGYGFNEPVTKTLAVPE